jgi:hypothetical protein
MSRKRTPGSWAMHTRTRAWLVRTLHSAIPAQQCSSVFLEIVCQCCPNGRTMEIARRSDAFRRLPAGARKDSICRSERSGSGVSTGSRRGRRAASAASPRPAAAQRPHERGAMANEDSPNQLRARQVAEGPERRQDGQDGAPVPSEIPVGPEGPSIGVPERRCWRCLQMFPGDPTREPTRTPEWWLCNPCDHVLLGAKLRAA